MDEQRSSRRCERTQEHAHANASRRKTGRTAGYLDREERNPDAVADANPNDGAQAEPEPNSNAKEFPATDRKADSEKERRTEGNAEANPEKGEGRFGEEIGYAEERIEHFVESEFREG